MIKIGICDDETAIVHQISEIVQSYFSHKCTYKVYRFSSSTEIIKHNIQYDILFLDIEMGDISGIEIAKLIRKQYLDTKIIFVTNYKNFTSSAFQVHAFQYLVKPIKRNELEKVLDDCIAYIDKSKEDNITINLKEKSVTIKSSKIFYIEVRKRTLYIHTDQEVLSKSGTLKEFYSKIKKFGFGMCHNAYIVNFYNIESIKGYNIKMKNGEIIPLAQQRALSFKNEYYDYLQNMFYLL